MDEFIQYFMGMDYYFYIFIYIGVFLIYYSLLKRVILNIFDPLLMTVIFSTFSIALMIYMYFDSMVSIANLVFFLLSILSFWLGYLLLHIPYRKAYKQALATMVSQVAGRDYLLITTILWIVLIASSLVVFLLRGVPLLSDNPSDQKVLLYQGGFGPVRYIHFLFPAAIVYVSVFNLFGRPLPFRLNLRTKSRDLFVFLILVTTLSIPVLSGSKGALLFIFGAISICLVYLKKNNYLSGYKKFFRYSIIFLVLAFMLLFTVVLLTPYSASQPFFSIFLRFMASGDTFFFYYGYALSDNFRQLFISDFFSYLLQPLLGMLSISNQEFPLGAYILHYATGWPLTTFGPNAQLPVVADIFFKQYFSPFFMFFMGIIVGVLRVFLALFLSKVKHVGVFLFVLVWFSSLGVLFDINFAVSKMYAATILFFPILVYLYLLLSVKRMSSR